MLTRIKFLLALLFCLSPFTSLHADWQHLPAGYPIANTIVSDSLGQKLLAPLSCAGLWLSDNGGTSWLPINTRLNPADLVTVSGIWTVDAACDTMIASIHAPLSWDHYHTVQTYNGGLTWQLMPDSSYSATYIILPRHHNIWFRIEWISQPELYRSDDYGLTWTHCPTLHICYPQNFVPDKAHDSTLLCCTYLDAFCDPLEIGIFQSTNLGQSWTRISDLRSLLGIQQGRAVDVARLTNGDLAAIVMSWAPEWSSGNIVISTNDGQTWQRIADSPTAIRGSRLIESPAHPGRLFMNTQCPGGIMRSDDFGRTWTVASGGLPAFESYAHGFSWNDFSGEMFVLYDILGVYHSRDDGDSWQLLNLPPTGMPYASIQIMPEAVFLLPWNSYDELPIPLQWELESPFTVWQPISIPSTISDSGYSVGPVFEKRADTLFTLAGIYSFEVRSYIDVQLLKSCDDGLSWHAASGIPSRLIINDLSILRDDSLTRIVAPVSYRPARDSLAYTDDFGSTWTVIPSPPVADSAFLRIAQSPQVIYVLVRVWDGYENQYSLWRTTDLGTTWNNLNLSAGYGWGNLLPISDELFIFRNAILWHWQNGQWDQRGEMGLYYPQLIGINRENLLLIAVDQRADSLWMSEDSGFTWTPHHFDYPFPDQNEQLLNACVDPYRDRIWASFGTGICYLDFSDLASDEPLHFKPADFTLLSVYPNPFNSNTRIRFDLDRTTHVSLKVYDLTGRLVNTIVDGMQSAGRHELNFNGKNLASGTYFVHLRTDHAQRLQKILLLK
jgi:hypothetical protein